MSAQRCLLNNLPKIDDSIKTELCFSLWLESTLEPRIRAWALNLFSEHKLSDDWKFVTLNAENVAILQKIYFSLVSTLSGLELQITAQNIMLSNDCDHNRGFKPLQGFILCAQRNQIDL